MELSVILPCQNEEATLGSCLRQIKEVFILNNIVGEIIVSDSSSDRSPEIAKEEGVVLVKHDQNGYGRAYLEAFPLVHGRYIFMADADGTYDFKEIPNFLNALKDGYDLVIGNRFCGRMEKSAMGFLRRYIGNPILSWILKFLYKIEVQDAHSGMRALDSQILPRLRLRTTGMEFASEMIMATSREGLRVKNLNIDYYRRGGKSKLKIFSDGWRHLRFMLAYAPDYLFFAPGVLFFLAGLALIGLWRTHVVYGSFLLFLGYNIVGLGVFYKAHLRSTGFITQDGLIDFLASKIKFETGLLLGAILILAPLLIWLKPVFNFFTQFGFFNSDNLIIFSLTLAVLGVQMFFFSFVISMILVDKKNE